MTSATRTEDEAQIRRLLASKVDALKAGDADWLVGSYAPDAVSFNLAPPLQHVAPELQDADQLRGWFATFDGPVEYEIRDLAVTVGADVAFCHSLNRLSAVPQGSTERFDLWFRSTVGLRKIDGTWQIVHDHDSTPFYMDGSFQAALDLKP